MKAVILSVITLLSLSSYAESNTTGEMPAAIKCQSTDQEFRIKIITHGKDVFLSGSRNGSSGASSLDYNCIRQDQASGDAILLFTCDSKVDEVTMKFYKRDGTTSASVVEVTSSGDIEFSALSCESTSL